MRHRKKPRRARPSLPAAERPICRRVSTCSTPRVSALRSRNLFQTTCQKKTARKHLHVYLCIRASMLMMAGGSARGARLGPEPATKCVTSPPTTLAPCLASPLHLRPPGGDPRADVAGRRWDGRSRLWPEILHSARQSVESDAKGSKSEQRYSGVHW